MAEHPLTAGQPPLYAPSGSRSSRRWREAWCGFRLEHSSKALRTKRLAKGFYFMASDWFYSRNGERRGPVSSSELRRLAATGQLLPSDLVWKEGMENWVRASSSSDLFPDASEPPAPPPPVDVPGGTRSAKETAKKIFERAESFARQVSTIARDAVSPTGFDELSQDTEKPGIFLRDEFFGGRTRIGAPMSSLKTTGAFVGSLLFSWAYLLPFVTSLGSSWEFLPFSRTEFVRIRLRQRIVWQRLVQILLMWCMTMFAFLVAALILFAFGAGLAQMLSEVLGASIGFLGSLVFVAGYFVANGMAWKQLAGLTVEDLHRCQISLEYGFPRKYQLLSGLSDAPVAKQIDGVLKLCDAISKTQFSSWDQFSTHGDNGHGLLGALFSRVSNIV